MKRILNSDFKKCVWTSDEPICCLDDLEDEDNCMIEQGVQHLRYLKNSIPSIIDMSEKSVPGYSIDIPDLSVASRNSTATHTSSSRTSIYGSIANAGVTVRNKRVI